MEDTQDEEVLQEAKPTKKQQFLEILKFTGFSISAGAMQLLSFSILYEWTACLPWWPSYLISIILSVIWNFTFNRKFTFKAANNIPLAMTLVLIYYAAFTPASVFGGDALEKLWGSDFGILVTVLQDSSRAFDWRAWFRDRVKLRETGNRGAWRRDSGGKRGRCWHDFHRDDPFGERWEWLTVDKREND